MKNVWQLISANSGQCILYSFSLYASLLKSVLFLRLCVQHIFFVTTDCVTTGKKEYLNYATMEALISRDIQFHLKTTEIHVARFTVYQHPESYQQCYILICGIPRN